jgi:hypothetical protein
VLLLLLLWLRVCQKSHPSASVLVIAVFGCRQEPRVFVLRLWLYHVSALGHAETSVDGALYPST